MDKKMQDALAEQAAARTVKKQMTQAAMYGASDATIQRIVSTNNTNRVPAPFTAEKGAKTAFDAEAKKIAKEREKLEKLRGKIEADPDSVRQDQLHLQLDLLKHYEMVLSLVEKHGREKLDTELLELLKMHAPKSGGYKKAQDAWQEKFTTGGTVPSQPSGGTYTWSGTPQPNTAPNPMIVHTMYGQPKSGQSYMNAIQNMLAQGRNQV